MASWQGCDETAEEGARRLAEELRQCQADKDFVWSLWKRLQEDKPDVSQVVRMVIQRENQRAEEKASKVLEILQVKDHKIRELEQQSNAQQRELDDLERRRAAVEESISLREQLSALSTHWKESTSKTQALRHKDVETESVLVQELRKRCADLQMLLDNAQDAAKAGIEKQQQADRLQNRVDELSSQLSVQAKELAQARSGSRSGLSLGYKTRTVQPGEGKTWKKCRLCAGKVYDILASRRTF
uniref:Centlein n=1 Tax=Eptatretus burgeri TaxID=7764 RepID=A0A8C4QQE9_EPTBU